MEAYNNYYDDYKIIESKAHDAALFIESNSVSKMIDNLSLANIFTKFIYDWDDKAEEKFKEEVEKLKTRIENINDSFTFYLQVEEVYTLLDLELQELKKANSDLQNFRREPRQSEYKKTKISYDKETKKQVEKKIDDTDKFKIEHNKWLVERNSLDSTCLDLKTQIDNMLLFLKNVNDEIITKDTDPKQIPSFSLKKYLKYNTDNALIDGNFGYFGSMLFKDEINVDQGITSKNQYYIKDYSMFSSYMSYLQEYFKGNLSVLNFLNNKSTVTKTENISKIMDALLKNGMSLEDARELFLETFELKINNNAKEVVDYLCKSYNMDELSANRILASMDVKKGICSYASIAEVIFSEYKDNPEEFYQDFGYPMYYEDSKGYHYNSEMLLADLYTYANKESNKPLYINNQNGEMIINPKYGENYLINCKNQVSLSYLESKNNTWHAKTDIINSFLKNKNSELSITADTYTIKESNLFDIKNILENASNDGSQVQFFIGNWDGKNDVVMTGLTGSNALIQSGTGHAAYVSSYDQEKISFTSYGGTFSISYDEILSSECTFGIAIYNINGI